MRRRMRLSPMSGRSGRRRMLAAVLLGAVVLPLTGCGNPPGIDGELADDWAPVSAPVAFVPTAPTCHAAGYAEVGPMAAYETVECTASHRTETIHVGTHRGAAATAAAAPAEGSAGARAAYLECDAKAREYVGADWRLGRLWLGVVNPSPQAWSGGARWFRCDMTEVTTVEDDGETATRTGSLRGVLKKPSPVSLTCYAVKLDSSGSIDTMPPADCGKVHNAEFVGIWTAPGGGYPKKDADWDRFHNECRKVIAKYVGVPADTNIRFRTGVVSLPGAEEQWELGNRGVRCYLWLNDRKLTRSLKGAGAKALPVQFEAPV